ncbi:MAG: hypothetical protein ACTSQY_04565 [Candidatus Odinarchaeia archaeon]
MGALKTLGISLLIAFLINIVVFIVANDIVSSVYFSKYSGYAEPTGTILAVLDTSLNVFIDIKVTIIVITFSIMGGIIYFGKESYSIGVVSSILIGFVLTVTVWKETGIIELILLLNILISIVIAGLAAAIPGILHYGYSILNKRKEEKIRLPLEEISIICPNCGTKYESRPLICSNCNYEFKETKRLTKEDNNYSNKSKLETEKT